MPVGKQSRLRLSRGYPTPGPSPCTTPSTSGRTPRVARSLPNTLGMAASQISLDCLEKIYRRHAYSDKGKTFIPVIYQRAIGDAEASLRANRVKAKLAELDPWDPEFWAAQEQATLAEMRYRFAPQEIISLQMIQMKQMVYLSENQCEIKEDADLDLRAQLPVMSSELD